MANLTSHIEIRTKVIYSFKSEIHLGAGEIADCSKTLASPPGTFTCLEEMQAYIEECEQKRLSQGNAKVLSKAYLPATKTIDTQGNYNAK